MVINVNEELHTQVNLQVEDFGVRRPVGALVCCDLSQLAEIEFIVDGRRRLAAADESGDRSPHSKVSLRMVLTN